jgi:hypothetical protein
MPESLTLIAKFQFSYVRHLAFVSSLCNRLKFLSDELLFSEHYEHHVEIQRLLCSTAEILLIFTT